MKARSPFSSSAGVSLWVQRFVISVLMILIRHMSTDVSKVRFGYPSASVGRYCYPPTCQHLENCERLWCIQHIWIIQNQSFIWQKFIPQHRERSWSEGVSQKQRCRKLFWWWGCVPQVQITHNQLFICQKFIPRDRGRSQSKALISTMARFKKNNKQPGCVQHPQSTHNQLFIGQTIIP